jgi:hypothetical protein
VPGHVTPGFTETRDGPLGALSEVGACGVWVMSALMFENLMYYSYVSCIEFFELEVTLI